MVGLAKVKLGLATLLTDGGRGMDWVDSDGMGSSATGGEDFTKEEDEEDVTVDGLVENTIGDDIEAIGDDALRGAAEPAIRLFDDDPGSSSRLLFFLLLLFSNTSSSSSSSSSILPSTPLGTGVGGARLNTGMESISRILVFVKKPGELGGGHVEAVSATFLLPLSLTLFLTLNVELDVGCIGHGGDGVGVGRGGAMEP